MKNSELQTYWQKLINRISFWCWLQWKSKITFFNIFPCCLRYVALQNALSSPYQVKDYSKRTAINEEVKHVKPPPLALLSRSTAIHKYESIQFLPWNWLCAISFQHRYSDFSHIKLQDELKISVLQSWVPNLFNWCSWPQWMGDDLT